MQNRQNTQAETDTAPAGNKKRIKISPLRVFIILIAGLMLGLSLYLINAGAFRGNSFPMPFGIGASVVLSGSMEPELSVDDVIIVRRAEDYLVGDVVVYQRMGTPVCHRIVSADGQSVVTRGDANNTPDEPISPSDICGKVVGKVPKAAAIVDFFRSPLGVILILGAAIALMELSFRRDKQKGDSELEQIKEEIRRLQNVDGTNQPDDE